MLFRSVLDRHLQEAFDRPERAVEILDKAKQLLSPGKEPNYPVIEIVTEIMDSPSSEGHVSNRLLKQRIREIRDRLWDAPVIAGQIRRELDLALQRPPFASIAARLSLEQRADLATVMMPLAKLETGDAYLNQDVA